MPEIVIKPAATKAQNSDEIIKFELPFLGLELINL
mgnify:CR=1 FL=1